MRKATATIFALLILLSSGFAQAVLHICPQDGVSILEESCKNHKTKSCCDERKGSAPSQEKDCCDEAYFFAVSPKFGSVKDTKFSDFGFNTLLFPSKIMFNSTCVEVEPTKTTFHSKKPPSLGRNILLQSNCLVI